MACGIKTYIGLASELCSICAQPFQSFHVLRITTSSDLFGREQGSSLHQSPRMAFGRQHILHSQEHAVFGNLSLPLPNAGALSRGTYTVKPFWPDHPLPAGRHANGMAWDSPPRRTTTSRSTFHRTDASALQAQATLWPWRTEDYGAQSDVQGVPATENNDQQKNPRACKDALTRPAV
ncbi:hypothetical protein B0H65DRAFT_444650 [Neurospora tetraspora]|uniref:Uncharacterized protein n=1 Tax=Neurospora tetraspora TaxID=94610 RepID=A0AAE0MQY4_9PEZI|nr:hypothetical protein B0H65DRAFT_444650 [Neurospora tetraspora]